jgi:hypothetical protein
LLYLTVLICVGLTIYWFAEVRRHREFRLGGDLHHALGVLNSVRLAEDRCYKARRTVCCFTRPWPRSVRA